MASSDIRLPLAKRRSEASGVLYRHFSSDAFGVGQPDPPEALSDVRRTDARSAQITCPDGVARSFQVRPYKVEPVETVFARNLFSNHDWRAALRDETVEDGPQVALVVEAAALAGCGEGLTGARAGPDGPVVGPSSQSGSVGPPTDPSEEMALVVSPEIVGSDFKNGSFIDVPRCDKPSVYEISQPLSRERIELVVIGAHCRRSSIQRRISSSR
jgi:hypothetical protein